MSRLADALAALPSKSVAALGAEWRRVHGIPPPACLTRDMLVRGIAWRLQERAHGGLAPATVRGLDRLARQLEEGREVGVERVSLRPGTRLVRDWQGRRHQVLVGESGFTFEDRHYRSLSQIARAITGAHWSGPRFFGLVKRGGTNGKAA